MENGHNNMSSMLPLDFYFYFVFVYWLLFTSLHHLIVVVCWAVWVNHLVFSVHCWFWF
jgi:hypothetical protein